MLSPLQSKLRLVLRRPETFCSRSTGNELNLANCSPVPQATACYVILPCQIAFRKKIPGACWCSEAARIDNYI